MPQPTLLRRLAAALHIGLAISLALIFGSLDLDPLMRVAIVVIALAPAAATLPGLMAGRPEPMRWLALLLVLYVGVGAVEVIARGNPAAIALLLFGLVELALVLNLARSRPSPGPRATGES